MLRDEVDDLIFELRAWAEQAEHGAQTELAGFLGVPKQRVNHWIAGRTIPNLRDGLKLQACLKKQRRAKSRGGMNWIAIIFCQVWHSKTVAKESCRARTEVGEWSFTQAMRRQEKCTASQTVGSPFAVHVTRWGR